MIIILLVGFEICLLYNLLIDNYFTFVNKEFLMIRRKWKWINRWNNLCRSFIIHYPFSALFLMALFHCYVQISW